MSRSTRTRTFARLLALLAASALPLALAHAQGSCLPYGSADVRLTGTLRLEVFAGAPHYRSLAEGDQPETVWLLQLDKPVCVAAAPGDESGVSRFGVTSVQIVPRTAMPLELKGRTAVVEGSLQQPRGTHGHADVLLLAVRVSPATGNHPGD